MKVAYISDLHIDYNAKFNILDAIVNELNKEKAEMLLIGGDISNATATTLEFVLNIEKRTGIKVHYIFGNHDYYTLTKDFHKDRAIQNTFPLVRIGEYGVIADTGWYDYRWFTAGFGNFAKLLRGKHSHGGTWPDHRFIKWPEDAGDDKSGRWFAKYSIEEMKRQNEVLDACGITKKIIMTHMIPHEDFLLKQWEYFETNVFFGGQSLSEFIDSVKPEITLFGHTHFTYDKMRNDSWCICSPLGYNFEWSMPDAEYEVHRKLVILDL